MKNEVCFLKGKIVFVVPPLFTTCTLQSHGQDCKKGHKHLL